MKSFDDRMREVDGYGPGFDLVRLVLASGVVIWHAWGVTRGTGDAPMATPFWVAASGLVPMFFALSGFLVAGSALRLPWNQYLLNRLFRIGPALFVEIMLSAFFLGPVFTTMAIGSYFSARGTWIYLLNILGYIHYHLPGVFLSNPIAGIVNGSLWTVPWEIGCYVIMTTLILLGLARHVRVVAALALLWILAAVLVTAVHPRTGFAIIDKPMAFFFAFHASLVVGYFLAGAALYLGRRHVPFDGRLALAFAVLLVAGSIGLDGERWAGQPVTALLFVVPMTYIVGYCGLVALPKLPIFDRGDYSYGIYLYHFPILQAIHAVYGFAHWGVLLAAGALPVVVTAMASWHFVEKPILKLRKRFSLVGARITREES